MRETMKRTKAFSCFLLLAFLGTLGGGCATLPNVSGVMEEVATPQRPAHIESAKGLLSPKQSTALMARLKRSVGAIPIRGLAGEG